MDATAAGAAAATPPPAVAVYGPDPPHRAPLLPYRGAAAASAAAVPPQAPALREIPLSKTDAEPRVGGDGGCGTGGIAGIGGGGDRDGNSGAVWLLCFFVHRLLDFRLADVEGSLEALGVALSDGVAWRQPFGGEPLSPLWGLRLPNEAIVAALAARATLVRGFVEVWGEGADWRELSDAVAAYPSARKEPWLRASVSYKVSVETFGCKLAHEEQVLAIKRLSEWVDFQGSVDLESPGATFWLVVCRSGGNGGVGDTVPDRLYFGRLAAACDRSRVDAYALKKRAYIGPTSMDAEVAFIMANIGKVKPGQLVLDPYAGTGSILVAAAEHGAQVLGGDIDMRVIKLGKTRPDGMRVDLYSNFQQYGLAPRLAGLLRMDMHTAPLRSGLEEAFHAILCDPPYGVRAGGRKSMPKEVEIRDRENRIPSTAPYSLGECLRDLLDAAARLLVHGGRLLYFLPSSAVGADGGGDEAPPQHPALVLVADIKQLLTTKYGRRLIAMEKVHSYDAEASRRFHQEHPDPTLAADQLHDTVYNSTPVASVAQPRFRGKQV